MDKVKEQLRKLPKPVRQRLIELASQLEAGNIDNIDIKKLSGYKDLCRIRLGQYRVVCRKHNNRFIILLIARRDDRTYKNLK